MQLTSQGLLTGLSCLPNLDTLILNDSPFFVYHAVDETDIKLERLSRYSCFGSIDHGPFSATYFSSAAWFCCTVQCSLKVEGCIEYVL